MIQIKAVDAENVGEVCKLAATVDCLGPAKCSAGCNAAAIAQASFHRDMHPNAIYHNHTLLGFFLYQRAESHAETATLCRFMVDGRFRQKKLEKEALDHVVRGLKIQGVKQIIALLDRENEREKALFAACGFHLTGEDNHGAHYQFEC